MSKKVLLLLIEDDISDAEKIVEAVQGFQNVKKNGKEFSFAIEHLQGQEEAVIKEKKYRFYDENVISQIQVWLDKKERNTQKGILLDVVLTRQELESKDKNFYPEVSTAKAIYNTFCKQAPVYIITSVASFFTHSEQIMGEDLSESFIPKDVLLKYQMQSMIDKMKDFYINQGEQPVVQRV